VRVLVDKALTKVVTAIINTSGQALGTGPAGALTHTLADILKEKNKISYVDFQAACIVAADEGLVIIQMWAIWEQVKDLTLYPPPVLDPEHGEWNVL
jgi:hypothetical protein